MEAASDQGVDRMRVSGADCGEVDRIETFGRPRIEHAVNVGRVTTHASDQNLQAVIVVVDLVLNREDDFGIQVSLAS